MTKEELKRALISILVGAIVAFLTTLFQGLFGLLTHQFANLSGAGAAMVWYYKSAQLT